MKLRELFDCVIKKKMVANIEKLSRENETSKYQKEDLRGVGLVFIVFSRIHFSQKKKISYDYFIYSELEELLLKFTRKHCIG